MELAGARCDASGARVQRTWTLRAPALNGPEIPCMAAILLALQFANAKPLAPGAYPCMGLLALSEFAPLFARWGIITQTQELML